jgi:DNA-binding NarL/FixJ family response regulator
LSRDLSDPGAIAQSLANLGHVAGAIGDMRTARERYTESLLIRRELGDRHGVAMTCGNLGVLAETAGDHELARQWLTESLLLARAVGDRRILGAALHQLAALDAACGNHAAAIAGYAESLQMLGQVQDRWGIARALAGCADVLHASGQPESAKQVRTMADGLLESMGARPSPSDQHAYARSQAAVEGTPRSPRVPGRSNRPEDPSQTIERALALLRSERTIQTDRADETQRDAISLTPRELEVAALIARGLTNREIAAELVIAERTADTHVSNLLGKLGMKTRSQIAGWAVEHHGRGTDRPT